MTFYDEALAQATDEEVRELLTINKADALIGLQQAGPEVDALPSIVMRRRSTNHTYLAAYALQYKFHLDGNHKRSLFYGNLALRAATEAENGAWERAVYLELGNVYGEDSQIDMAASSFERVLETTPAGVLDHTRGGALEGLGYCRILQERPVEAIGLLDEALQHFSAPFERAETYIDLCYAHLELDQLETAQRCGNSGLELAQEPRQIRNAHYLLGEVAYKLDDVETAEHHFSELTRFYPNFANLKQLLYAFDLRKIVNLKLS